MRESGTSTFIEIPLRDFYGFIIRGLPWAILCTALAIAAVWLFNRDRPVMWTASAYLLSVRQDQAPSVVRGVVPGSLDPTLYRAAVVDGPVLDAVKAGWNPGGVPLPDDHELLLRLRVESDNQLRSSVVRVSYQAQSPQLATGIVNSVARELLEWDRQRTLRPLQDWNDRLRQELAQLDAELASAEAGSPARQELQLARDQRVTDLAELQSTLPLSQLSLLREARVPAEPDGRGTLSSLALAMVFGVLAGYLIQLLRTIRRGTPTTTEAELGPA